ncbi:prepilin-type N-terminal cleavage/methylation domain-containing protein [Halodesulfovibrio sp.]|jgi:general secretion pathway protein I|uniref:type IV pilus modification PilV family protein n=1 Tax=Halodesulfovibrio sp. TaxID=1912772 RepID=UPI0025F970AA|nr:prepilin-type N-terminal cleavage/methylation domain-containing protein [Halodesulfovibrio sp.]MCT4535747.1 prepilin-type N-terminal cleavage/methylation domain-containing protein [Halodesulfovibrio sp.]MCT4627387.1 prepilin-type N-terminal cleavage/methylation domain-containing protein [Halodesulfovibrio sp.]
MKHIDSHSGSSNQQGFTIIEVLVALVLLSIAVLMTIELTTQNQEALSKTHMQDTATLLAREKLFELEQDGLSASTGKSGNFGADNRNFKWEARAHSTNRLSSYRLEVTVTWGKEKKRHVTIEKIFTE